MRSLTPIHPLTSIDISDWSSLSCVRRLLMTLGLAALHLPGYVPCDVRRDQLRDSCPGLI